MKLYYSPGTCALVPHIVANEAGIALDLVKVKLASKKTEDGTNYLEINPNGYVPALVLDDGKTLTEASVLGQYLADLKLDSGLMPQAGTFERYKVLQWLSFISTELHKNYSPLFRSGMPEAVRAASRALLTQRFGYVETELADGPFLTGATFTVADAYLWTVLGWARLVEFDISGFARLQHFMAEVAARPAVQRSLQEQGLV